MKPENSSFFVSSQIALLLQPSLPALPASKSRVCVECRESGDSAPMLGLSPGLEQPCSFRILLRCFLIRPHGINFAMRSFQQRRVRHLAADAVGCSRRLRRCSALVPFLFQARFPWQRRIFLRLTDPGSILTTAAPCRRIGKDRDMKKTIASVCLSFLLTTTAFAASTKDDLQGRIDSARVVLDQIMGAKDQTIPSNILRSGHLRRGGSGHGEGRVSCRRTVRPGRSHLPHRPWLERAGVHPHGGRFLRLPDRRPGHGSDPDCCE